MRHVLTAFLVMLAAAVGPTTAASLGPLFRSVDDVARGASRSEADNLLRGTGRSGVIREMHASDDAIKNLTASEAEELERAIIQFRITPRGDMGLLRKATLALRGEAGDAKRTIPFSDDLPNLRIRAPQIAEFDDQIRAFAHARILAHLNEPFDVSDLSIVTLGLADSFSVSTREARRFANGLPASVRDKVGPFTRIRDEVDHREMVRSLEPYRGSTVILVGHIPKGESTFIHFTPSGQARKIPLKEWSEAAKASGVNLIPIGCNSGRFAEFGVKGQVNSADVLSRLQDILRWQPRSIGTFLNHLTGNDLQIVIDPLEVRLFSNGAQIVTRDRQALVGRIKLEGLRIAARTAQSSNRPASARAHYAPCFAEPNSEGFDQCAARVQKKLEDEARIRQEVEKRQQNERRMREIPTELNKAEKEHSLGVRRAVAAGLLFFIAWVAGGLLIPHGLIVHATAQNEEESALRLFFHPVLVRHTLGVVWQRIRSFFPSAFNAIKLLFTEDSSRGSSELVFLGFLIPLLAGALVYITPISSEVMIALVIFAALGGWFAVGLVWEALKSSAGALMVPPLAYAALIAAGVYYFQSFAPIQDAEDRITSLNQERTRIAAELTANRGP